MLTQLTNGSTPTIEEVARQFEVKPLETRLEFLSPYGRNEVREQPFPDGGGPGDIC
jgi:hypothetical protein